MHVSILESGDGGSITENIARGGIFIQFSAENLVRHSRAGMNAA